MAGVSQPDEPGLGGWLEIWTDPCEDDGSRRVDLPRNVDVYGIADDGEFLYVVGSGMFSMKIHVDSLTVGEWTVAELVIRSLGGSSWLINLKTPTFRPSRIGN